MLKYLWRRYGINPFDQLLKRAAEDQHTRFLICWNRGLGDIPLGLYGLVHRIQKYIPGAKVTFATRPDLADGFKMLPSVSTLIDPEYKRGVPANLDDTLKKAGLTREDFDVIIEQPDPARWLLWQLGKLTPRLHWNPEWDALSSTFSLSKQSTYIGVHVQTETNYAYEKNWPLEYWKELFQRVAAEHRVEIILFGFAPQPSFDAPYIHDLRGKTSLFEMLSIIKNHCRYLLVPDSGVLSMTYYIDGSFPIDIVSLWADPRQGVLKQNVASPNPQLRHRPLLADQEDLRNVTVDAVLEALFQPQGVT